MTAALQRLLVWLSPAFPTGGFAYSAGLETAIVKQVVRDGESTCAWIDGLLHHGSLWTDAVLLAAAHQNFADTAQVQELADLAVALCPAAERVAETQQIGAAFAAAASAWSESHAMALPAACPFPVVVGALTAQHGIALKDALLAFLTAAVQTQISVAVRLVPIGQSEGLRLSAALEPAIAVIATRAAASSLADLGGIGYAADIAQMQHETLAPRIFRS